MLLVVNGFVLVQNARIYRRMKGYVTNSRQLEGEPWDEWQSWKLWERSPYERSHGIVLEDLHMGQHQINFMVDNAPLEIMQISLSVL